MYQIGDLILYNSMGVCRVTDIVTQDLPGAGINQLFYILSPLYLNCIITTPVENPKVYMRPIISKDEAERLIDMIPSIQAKAFHSRDLRLLAGHYDASLKTHDCEDLIELSMSIYAKKQLFEQQRRKFGATDERFMKRAEELLYGEMAAALGISKDKVPAYIAARLENADGKGCNS